MTQMKQKRGNGGSTMLRTLLFGAFCFSSGFFLGSIPDSVGYEEVCRRMTEAQAWIPSQVPSTPSNSTVVSDSEKKNVETDTKIDRNEGKSASVDPASTVEASYTQKQVDGLVQEALNKERLIRQRNFSPDLNYVAHSYTSLDRQAFMKAFDVGVPVDEPYSTAHMNNEHALLIYGNGRARPANLERNASDVVAATAKCSSLRVVFQSHSARAPCLAIVPQYESHVVHKFTRLPPEGSETKSHDMSFPLRYVSRLHRDNGYSQAPPGTTKHTNPFMAILHEYLRDLPRVQQKLLPILDRISPKGDKNKDIVVTVANFGVRDIFANFICSARARNIDLSRVLLFATDEPTYNFATSLGIHAFYDEQMFKDIPTDASKSYGDKLFVQAMFVKVFSVHLVNSLGYDVLFQDADVVWYKDPLPHFHTFSDEWDFIFQDDGARSQRFAPYSGNSGFFYVRSNARTKFFFSMFARLGDAIASERSHQSVMITLMSEHATSNGLRVKVIPRGNTSPFPCGYEVQNRKDRMKEILLANRVVHEKYPEPTKYNDTHPYVLHMSWTDGTATKRKYFEQLGEWHFQEECLASNVISAGACCRVRPEPKCHYRDKASLYPCSDSPPQIANKPGFW